MAKRSNDKTTTVGDSTRRRNGLEKEDWFHGLLPREDINRMLVRQGDFLVRESEVEGHMKHVLSVFWENQKRHVLLHKGTSSVYIERNQAFPDISQLVNYYHKKRIPLPTFPYLLLNPILRHDWELRHDQITTQRKLGEGAFGEVYAGELNKRGAKYRVAIKKSHERTTLSKTQLLELMKESRLLQKFKHNNIVRFHGVAADYQPVMICMELVSGGGLDTYLKKNKPLSFEQKLRFCRDAAEGLKYLHDNSCVHRDIAARNCLITGDGKTVKISDFGLSTEGGYYKMDRNAKVPIRWLAPETISKAYYNFKTDVWSFGILIWEIFNDGQEPYPGMKPMEVQQRVKEGYRMSTNEFPKKMQDVVNACWQPEATRPTMDEILKQLKKIYT